MKYTGWLRDLPDDRDHTVTTSPVAQKLSLGGPNGTPEPRHLDLRKWCSPVEDQGDIGSCTAQAAVGLMEYLQRRTHGRHINMSRLFTYYVTRRLAGLRGDSGAYLRNTMGATALLGCCPEQYWPYEPDKFDQDPGAFQYALAAQYRVSGYFRLDPPGTKPGQVLAAVKSTLNRGLPCVFGFVVYKSISLAKTNGLVPPPDPTVGTDGGHAVLAVGYDDSIDVNGQHGAILFRNSWGSRWGLGGYGWLPYSYIERELALDWWSAATQEFVDLKDFQI